ncbi:polyhydroxyalkanoate synthesis repressor PhaR [Roseateles oligotrophus]|uniref:Polyhydroxyalkanoate synthesis repressor PhaR n=1 Tax=Roseateles oligotrophus TaxID=1769250 RepID=A0ABT2YH14_9BURK|nr:polyhydroxyalkanoate synthesis repressor PhaR [Roseateles oligotrophus]MCV2369338.1 polyhydroxyalkanoate synthesis repressor PhaR [Roseateles oligotrophus]
MVTARKKAAGGAAGQTEGDQPAGVRVLKKYPNRRLYDTQTSSYITLADVKKMVFAGQAFEVRDAKTAEDLTRSILLQIILEEETGGVPMFSTAALEQIIRFYGHAMQGVMGDYLEKNVQSFGDLQTKFAEQSQGLAFSPELWTQFLGAQAPMMQGLMGGYAEQSKSLISQMQEKMQEQMQQASSLFPGMAGIPGMPGFPKK